MNEYRAWRKWHHRLSKYGWRMGQHFTTQSSSDGAGLGSFAGRVVVVLGIGALGLALWQLADVLLLIFGAILIAIGLCGAAQAISQTLGVPRSAALAAVVFVGTSAVVIALWFFGSSAATQLTEVIRQVPTGLSMLSDRLNSHRYGRQVLEQAQGVDFSTVTSLFARSVGTAARALTQTITFAFLIFFLAVYLAAQPQRYREICLRLVPPGRRYLTKRLFDEVGHTLRRWLLGQAVVMVTIGTLSGLGLWGLGIEAAFGLGLVGGLLTFIPYVGAILAAVPATLVALTQGPIYALSVIAMYGGVHFIEGNFITPLVQAEATALPPVLSLLSTVVFAVLFGPSAVLLAVPLMLLVMVTVEVVYVETALGEPRQTSRAIAVRTVDPSGERTISGN
jgi:predicted PurR-regulated permease PerM